VFESGIGTGTTSETAKHIRKSGSKEHKGAEIMRALRKATASGLERNKVSSSETAVVSAGEDDDNEVIGYHGTDWAEFAGELYPNMSQFTPKPDTT
jgi:hypothetical protein